MGPDGAESHGWDLTVLSHTSLVDNVFKQSIKPIVKQIIRFGNKFGDLNILYVWKQIRQLIRLNLNSVVPSSECLITY